MTTPSVGVVVCMGVAGTGKTSLAKRLAPRLDAIFVEGDDLHPAASRRRMEAGEPLTDGHRWPWLYALADVVASHREDGRDVVVTCSALKRSYRDLLRERIGGRVMFVHLRADPSVLRERLEGRTGHFMPSSQVADQLNTLEPPESDEPVIAVDAAASVADVVDVVYAAVLTAVDGGG